jgi:HK97 gp10 family phage protein
MKVEGLDALARALGQLPEAVGKRVQRQALKAGAVPIRDTATRLAPRSDEAPHMADSIRTGAYTRNESEEAVEIGPTGEHFYGLFQELGTKHHAAQPFLRPAYDQHAAEALEIVRQHLWAALAKRKVL